MARKDRLPMIDEESTINPPMLSQDHAEAAPTPSVKIKDEYTINGAIKYLAANGHVTTAPALRSLLKKNPHFTAAGAVERRSVDEDDDSGYIQVYVKRAALDLYLEDVKSGAHKTRNRDGRRYIIRLDDAQLEQFKAGTLDTTQIGLELAFKPKSADATSNDTQASAESTDASSETPSADSSNSTELVTDQTDHFDPEYADSVFAS